MRKKGHASRLKERDRQNETRHKSSRSGEATREDAKAWGPPETAARLKLSRRSVAAASFTIRSFFNSLHLFLEEKWEVQLLA